MIKFLKFGNQVINLAAITHVNLAPQQHEGQVLIELTEGVSIYSAEYSCELTRFFTGQDVETTCKDNQWVETIELLKSESDIDKAVVEAVAAEFNQPVATAPLKLMTLGQIKKQYPNIRGVVSDAGLIEFEYLLDKYSPEYLFKDYIEGVYGGDYFGRWDHYVDRNNVISI
jgi:hypothetical protein